MDLEKDNFYFIDFQDSNFPEHTHFTGYGVYTGETINEKIDRSGIVYDALLYGFRLTEYPDYGICFFEREFIDLENTPHDFNI